MPPAPASHTAAHACVTRLCTEWPSLTRQDLHDLLTPDCLYLNMPMPHRRCIGPDQAYDLIAGFVSAWKMDLRLLHLRGDDAVVLTERLERFESRTDPTRIAHLQVMGAFELRNGKIAHWRDYFDSRESQALTA